MAITFPFKKQEELAQSVPVDTSRARAPQYGRYLEEFVPGQIFVHPRGLTIDRAMSKWFCATFLQCNPLYLNTEYALAHGFEKSVVSPQHVFNVVLSLGVQNDSEKAMANLGYYNAQFLRPVYCFDTIRSMTKVVDRRERGEGKPGIVHIQTLGINQHDQVVLQYERKIMVKGRGDRPPTTPAVDHGIEFPWVDNAQVELPVNGGPYPTGLTGPNTYFEDYQPGDIIVHANGRTVTDEHLPWTYGVGNTHPLHYDRVYSTGLSGAMSGEPIVYGGLVFAWLEGLASRDVSENALWELGFTEGYHTQPTIAGQTVAALSRVLACEDGPEGSGAGIVTFQFIGVRDMSAQAALDEHGEDLFIKENEKKKLEKEKIPTKIFEIERKLLIKKRPA